MFKFKKGISPVIAVILLLSITVVISMSMYLFIQDYAENSTSSLSSTNFNSVKVIGVYGDNLYLDSEESELFSLFQIKDLSGNIQCEIRDSKQSTFQGDTRLLMTFDKDTFNGTHVKDKVSNEFFETIHLTSTNRDCSSKECFYFNGSGFINLTESLNFQKIFNASEFSINIWFNTDSIMAEDAMRIITFSKGVSRSGFGIGLINSSLSFGFRNTSIDEGQYNLFNISENILVNVDYHLVMNRKNSDIFFYLNGEEIKLIDYIDLNNTFNDFSNNTASVGNLQFKSFFNGTIDEFAIYSKALNPEEVSQLYNLKSAKFYEQLLSTQTKEIDVSNCNLNKNQKYEFVGILESGVKINEQFISK